MSDAIRVSARVRPSAGGGQIVLREEGPGRLAVEGESAWSVDEVFGPTASQASVFHANARPILEDLVQGFNGTIFAYGQTGAGKTHTMVGPEGKDGEEAGLIPRALHHLFLLRQRALAEPHTEFRVFASFCELYREGLYDLLNETGVQLVLRDGDGEPWVEGLREDELTDLASATALLHEGLANRRHAETAMNHQSSRSHALFTLRVHITRQSGGVFTKLSSKLHLVDLAGSERQSHSKAVGTRLKEANSINQALSSLAKVISDLVHNMTAARARPRFVSYRTSKLTHLLKNALGGNSRTCLIVCVHPDKAYKAETMSTLRFAASAKLIRNQAARNETVEGVSVEALRSEVVRLTALLREAQEAGSSAGLLSGGALKLFRVLNARAVVSMELLGLERARNSLLQDSLGQLQLRLSLRSQRIASLEKSLAASAARDPDSVAALVSQALSADAQKELATSEKEITFLRSENERLRENMDKLEAQLVKSGRKSEEGLWAQMECLVKESGEELLPAELAEELAAFRRRMEVLERALGEERKRAEDAEATKAALLAQLTEKDAQMSAQKLELQSKVETLRRRSTSNAVSEALTPPPKGKKKAQRAFSETLDPGSITPAQRRTRRQTMFDPDTSSSAAVEAEPQAHSRKSTYKSIRNAIQEEEEDGDLTSEQAQIRRLNEELEDVVNKKERLYFRIETLESAVREAAENRAAERAANTASLDSLAQQLESEKHLAAAADALKAKAKALEYSLQERSKDLAKAELTLSKMAKEKAGLEKELEAALEDATRFQKENSELVVAVEESERREVESQALVAEAVGARASQGDEERGSLELEVRQLSEDLDRARSQAKESAERENKFKALLNESRKESSVVEMRLERERAAAFATGEEKGKTAAQAQYGDQLHAQSRELDLCKSTLTEQMGTTRSLETALRERYVVEEGLQAELSQLRKAMEESQAELATLAGHANHEQKIRYVEKVNAQKAAAEMKAERAHEELVALRTEVARLRGKENGRPHHSPATPHLKPSPSHRPPNRRHLQ